MERFKGERKRKEREKEGETHTFYAKRGRK